MSGPFSPSRTSSVVQAVSLCDARHASAGATVTVHYVGFLSTGKRFANSLEKGKPATVPLKDVIPGMQVGGKRRLIVPANLAYGAKGFKEIVPPNSTLVYEIELTGYVKPAEPPAPPRREPTRHSRRREPRSEVTPGAPRVRQHTAELSLSNALFHMGCLISG